MFNPILNRRLFSHAVKKDNQKGKIQRFSLFEMHSIMQRFFPFLILHGKIFRVL